MKKNITSSLQQLELLWRTPDKAEFNKLKNQLLEEQEGYFVKHHVDKRNWSFMQGYYIAYGKAPKLMVGSTPEEAVDLALEILSRNWHWSLRLEESIKFITPLAISVFPVSKLNKQTLKELKKLIVTTGRAPNTPQESIVIFNNKVIPYKDAINILSYGDFGNEFWKEFKAFSKILEDAYPNVDPKSNIRNWAKELSLAAEKIKKPITNEADRLRYLAKTAPERLTKLSQGKDKWEPIWIASIQKAKEMGLKVRDYHESFPFQNRKLPHPEKKRKSLVLNNWHKRYVLGIIPPKPVNEGSKKQTAEQPSWSEPITDLEFQIKVARVFLEFLPDSDPRKKEFQDEINKYETDLNDSKGKEE